MTPGKSPVYSEAGRPGAAESTALRAGILFFVCAALLVANLGRAGLFEPDEGRNAEIAREILLLKDWVTPHYDFLPRLDKPILFFDLVALSFQLFGISEWAARLPAALAALACVAVTHRLSRTLHGRAAALWSALILVTSIEFFALSQIVILDMLLALLLTLGLSCFFWGERVAERGGGRSYFLLMYIAFGAAVLTKGPIGLVLPAMVIFSYIIATRRWALLRQMELPLGVPLFFLTAAPWYILAEARNPGYLRHFLLQENFVRFVTTRFHRTQPWYFYLLALPAGFFPWTVLLPGAIVDWCRRPAGRERVFLIVWALAPLLFLSFSFSKMAHYILPIFPPLAILVGATIVRGFRESRLGIMRATILPGGAFLLLGAAMILALTWPGILPRSVQMHAVAGLRHISAPAIAGLLVALCLALAMWRSRLWRSPTGIYLTTAAAFALVLLLAPAVTAPIADHRSSRLLARAAVPHIGPSDRLVLYGGYPSSLPFYLKLQRPIWVVWAEDKRQILGSDYVALERPDPAPGYGQVLYHAEEFAELWKNSDERLLAFVSSRSERRFSQVTGAPLTVLLRAESGVLVANRPPRHEPLSSQ